MAKIWAEAHYEMPLEENVFLPPGNMETPPSVPYLKRILYVIFFFKELQVCYFQASFPSDEYWENYYN